MIDKKETITLPRIGTITCLNDVPKLASRSFLQQRISRSYKLVALAPFAVVLFVVLKFFPNSTNRAWDFAIFLSLGWAMAVAGYAFYSLFWGVRCPACSAGFGVRDQCRSCGLPRHQSARSNFDELRLFEEE
jgi:hypothetical protein